MVKGNRATAKYLSQFLVSIVLTWDTVEGLIRESCQTITILALSTETSHTVETIVIARNCIKLCTVGSRYVGHLWTVAVVVAMCHQCHVQIKVIVYAVARLDSNFIVKTLY